MKWIALIVSVLFGFLACSLVENPKKREGGQKENGKNQIANISIEKKQKTGKKIIDRFEPPIGYKRVETEETSFAHYLQNLPLKAAGSKVYHYDGNPKGLQSMHAAVIDLDVGKRDLQQCADAIMRLRAEHLYAQKDFDKIQFNFTNGFEANYSKWRKGYRIKVKGNKVTWIGGGTASDSYASFRKYLIQVFSYAGTLSLEKELETVNILELEIGDVFIQGGSPGHAIVVVDMAVNKTNNKKAFLLAQSYMPAQDIHILKNLENKDFSPWYTSDFGETLETPEWTFSKNDLKRF